VCRVHEDACVLGGNDGIDDGCQIVHVGKRFYTKDDIVKCAFSTGGCLLGCSYDCIYISRLVHGAQSHEGKRPNGDGCFGRRVHTMSGLEPLIAKVR
jgi:hypothetical protein